MSLTTLEYKILSYVVDDYYGLWELQEPGTDIPQMRELIESMMAKGLVQVVTGLEFTGEEQVVDRAGLLEALDDVHWKLPQAGDKQTRVLATPRGVAEYQEPTPS